MTEQDILFERGGFWVFKGHDAYHVMRNTSTHAVTDSAFPLTEDGYSLAVARCTYMGSKDMKPIDKTQPLTLGQRVHCILYGGKDGTIVAIHGQQTPATCRSSSIVVSGGSATFEIVWDDDTKTTVPEALVRGSVQWRILPEVVGEVEVAQAIMRASIAVTDKKARAEEAAQRRATECERIRAEFPHLTTTEQHNGRGSLAAINIRKELKRAFPGVKFRVTSRQRASVSIYWTDGPSRRAVCEVTGKYAAGHFDGMTDCYHHSTDAWNDVFGSTQYVFEKRSYSDEQVAWAIEQAGVSGTVEQYRNGKLWDEVAHIHRVLERG